MKTPMLSCAVAVIVTTGIVVLLTPAKAAPPPCEPVSGEGETAVADVPAVFVGSATLSIGGDEFEVAATTVLLGEPVEGDDGTLRAPTSHTFSFDDENSFTTTDRAVLEPTDVPGVFTLNSNMRITSGTGDFEGARGRLHSHGEIDLNGFPFAGEASWRVHGVLCN